jgi:ubiquitin C-terminal hydrolase
MENEKVFGTWFKVNVHPFKQALLNIVCKWGNLFKKHLVDHVINRYERLMVHVIVFHKSSLLKEKSCIYSIKVFSIIILLYGVLWVVRDRMEGEKDNDY